jgi:hypothetical protein
MSPLSEFFLILEVTLPLKREQGAKAIRSVLRQYLMNGCGRVNPLYDRTSREGLDIIAITYLLKKQKGKCRREIPENLRKIFEAPDTNLA